MKKGKKAADGDDDDVPMGTPAVVVSEEDTDMPPGMEEWLRAPKRVVKKKDQVLPAKPTRGKRATATSINPEDGGKMGTGVPRQRSRCRRGARRMLRKPGLSSTP